MKNTARINNLSRLKIRFAKDATKMEKDKFIENILNSTSGIIKVMPNDLLFTKIQSKIEANKPVDKYTKWLVAASIAILISLNVILLNKASEKKPSNNFSELEIVTDNQLYKAS